MVEYGNFRTISRTNTTDGHDIDLSFIVENLSASEPLVFQHTYHTNCEVLPTSFSFQVIFPQATENGTVSCIIRLRRDDLHVGKPLKTFIWMSFFDGSGQLVRFPKKLSNDHMQPENEINEYVPDCIPFGGLVNLPQQRLFVDVTIFIRCCHMIEDGTDSVANLRRDLSNMFVS